MPLMNYSEKMLRDRNCRQKTGNYSGWRLQIIEYQPQGGAHLHLLSGDRAADYYTSGYLNIWLSVKEGYKKFEMVGMYHRNLKKSDMGEFEGFAVAEEHNIHDRFAVAIYKIPRKHIGYLPRGNRDGHKFIQENGGNVPAYGFISCDRSGENFVAQVGVKID